MPSVIDIVLILVLALMIGGAVWYIVKAKKSGKKCIGCPDSGSCASHKESSCGCYCTCCEEKHSSENQ